MAMKVRDIGRKLRTKIHRPTNDNVQGRIRYNGELYQLFDEPDIIKVIKGRRVRWLARLFRTHKLYPCRKLMFSKPEGTRRVGKPSIR
jgi:hypothetical protein